MRSPGRVFWPFANLVVLADCTTRRVVESTVDVAATPRPLIADPVRVTLTYNPGAAFSSHVGPYQRWVLLGIVVGLLGVLAVWYRATVHVGRVATVGAVLLLYAMWRAETAGVGPAPGDA
jgi:lipoprotein signal peptidase